MAGSMPAVSFQSVCKTYATPQGPFQALNRLPAGLHSMAQLYGVLPLLVAPTATNEPA